MSSFTKNVITLSLAPIITQVLGFFVLPIVTRLYSPSDLGLVAIYGSIIGPLGVFSNLAYSSAIILPKKEEEATNLFAICLFFTIVVALLSTSFIFLKNTPILSWLKVEELSDYLWLIPVSLIFHGLYMSFRYWNIRNQRYGYISTAKIFRFITNNGIILIAGFAGHASGLFIIFGGIVGGMASIAVLSKSVWKKNKQMFIESIRFSKMKRIAIKYSKFPKFILLNNFFEKFTAQMPVYILSIYFSQTIIGFYALGLRLLGMPMNLLGNAIGEVFFQKASQEVIESSILLEKLFKYLVFFGLPVFCFLGLVGAESFSVIFGEAWREAGLFAQILSLFMLTKFITTPASYLMLLFEKQEYSIYLNIATLIVSCISLIIGGVLENATLSLLLFSISNSIIHFLYGVYFMNLGGLKPFELFHILLKTALISLPLVSTIFIIKIIFSYFAVELP